jgi:eukaryotic-like serine/threonine-protein kinase
LPQADSEFDRCFKRRGEALSLFLDDQPTFGYLPPLYYYRGRVWEELKTSGFADAYRTYLDIRGKAGEDPLLPEVRRRAGV